MTGVTVGTGHRPFRGESNHGSMAISPSKPFNESLWISTTSPGKTTFDLIISNNKKFLDYLKEIYPSQLTVEKANKSDHLADYLDLTFIVDSGGKLSTRLYDKCDDFDFHIVNFPFLSSNIPSGLSYGVYISQLIRYA